MNAPSRAFDKVARHVVETEVGDQQQPELVGRAIDGTFVRLEQVVSSMVGEVGFRALMVRALHLTRERSPNDVMLPSELAACSPGEGWTIAVERTGVGPAKECASLLIAALLDLLASFIGPDLTFRLVRRAWPGQDATGSNTPPGGDLQ